MRRKQGELVKLERNIIELARDLRDKGENEFYGLQIAHIIRPNTNHLISSGTLYRALIRLENMCLLSSRWDSSGQGNRPRRRYYWLVEPKK